MNDNRMNPQERSRYWTQAVAVPGGALCYLAVAHAPWVLVGYVVLLCGVLQFVYNERPVHVRISMPVFLAMLAATALASFVDVVLSAVMAAGLLYWRARDFRRVNLRHNMRDLIRSDRGQVYAAVILIFILGVILTLVKYYIPLHFEGS